MEIAILLLSVAMLVLSYLYARTRKVAYNYAFIIAAIIKTQVMLVRDKELNALPVKSG